MTGTPSPKVSVLGDAVFISYTHIDNEPFGPRNERWISLLDEQFTNRLQMLVGEEVAVWRDDKLQGNDVFADSLSQRLAHVAVLIAVCSPRYLKSEWCQRELSEFIRAAEASGGIQVGTKSRLFKVVKTPVPLEELQPPLDRLLGYEFYERLEEGDRFREFLVNPDETERWKFWARVDDLANDVWLLLKELAEEHTAAPAMDSGRVVYLGTATSDVAASRDDLKRELERRGFNVIPTRELPLVGSLLSKEVTADLSRADFAIHLIGSSYGARPEGDDRSISECELALASEFASRADLVQFIWIADGLTPSDEKQAELIGRLETNNIVAGVEVVRSPLDRFKTYVLDTMAHVSTGGAGGAAQDGPTVYLVCDTEDRVAAEEVRARLETAGCTVVMPLHEGSESDVRQVHESSMVLSDAVVVYYGHCTDRWVRLKLLDMKKAPGWGRGEPYRATAVWLGPPMSPEKRMLPSDAALILEAADDSSHSVLEPFLALLDVTGTGA